MSCENFGSGFGSEMGKGRPPNFRKRNFLVSVHRPPSFEKNDPELSGVAQEVIHYGSIILNWKVGAGSPIPTITWFHNNVDISTQFSQRRKFSRNKRKLYLIDAEQEDSGTYKCIAKNIAGSTEKNIQLLVLTPPEITSHVKRLIWKDTDIGSVLKCPVEGFPQPNITWYKLGKYL